MGLISFLPTDLSEVAPDPVRQPDRCLRKRLNTNQCESCMRACPSNAITIKEREVVFTKEKCSSCMSCVAVCPQDAFETTIDLETALRGPKNGSHFFITCVRQKKSSHEDVVVPCVGIFSLEAIAYLLLSCCGAISINLSACTECRNSSVATAFIDRFNKLNHYFQGHKTAEVNLLLERDQVEHVPCDRRAYLSDITKMASRVVAGKLMGAGSNLPQVEEKRRRVPGKVTLVKNLLERTEKSVQEKVTTLFKPGLLISDECNVCPLCKGMCPTGALTIVRAKSAKVLSFNALDCSSCGLCVEFCRKKAIALQKKKLSQAIQKPKPALSKIGNL